MVKEVELQEVKQHEQVYKKEIIAELHFKLASTFKVQTFYNKTVALKLKFWKVHLYFYTFAVDVSEKCFHSL